MTVPLSVLCKPLYSLVSPSYQLDHLPIPHLFFAWYSAGVREEMLRPASTFHHGLLQTYIQIMVQQCGIFSQQGHRPDLVSSGPPNRRKRTSFLGEEWRRAIEKLYILAWTWIFVKSGPAGVLANSLFLGPPMPTYVKPLFALINMTENWWI